MPEGSADVKWIICSLMPNDAVGFGPKSTETFDNGRQGNFHIVGHDDGGGFVWQRKYRLPSRAKASGEMRVNHHPEPKSTAYFLLVLRLPFSPLAKS